MCEKKCVLLDPQGENRVRKKREEDGKMCVYPVFVKGWTRTTNLLATRSKCATNCATSTGIWVYTRDRKTGEEVGMMVMKKSLD